MRDTVPSQALAESTLCRLGFVDTWDSPDVAAVIQRFLLEVLDGCSGSSGAG